MDYALKVRSEGRFVILPLAHIVAIEPMAGEQHSALVITTGARSYPIEESIEQIEKLFSGKVSVQAVWRNPKTGGLE